RIQGGRQLRWPVHREPRRRVHACNWRQCHPRGREARIAGAEKLQVLGGPVRQASVWVESVPPVRRLLGLLTPTPVPARDSGRGQRRAPEGRPRKRDAMKFLRMAARHWLGGKAVMLYEHTRADAVIARVETPGGKVLGTAEMRADLFDDPLDASAHARMIESITDGRVQFDCTGE